jgi:death-on-curing protein
MNGEAEPVFLSLEQVLILHRQSLVEHGGLDGIRDPGAIDSALASAQNTWYYAGGDLFDIAAAYAFHIAESQGFLDGNKRTAIASAITFLAANGCADAADDMILYDAMIALAKRRLDKRGLADVLRRQFPRA